MKTNRIRALAITAFAALFASCAATHANVRPYPSDVCIVTDNKLGSMGDPVVKVYGDQEVKFCCRPCVAEFEDDKERFLAKLRK